MVVCYCGNSGFSYSRNSFTMIDNWFDMMVEIWKIRKAQYNNWIYDQNQFYPNDIKEFVFVWSIVIVLVTLSMVLKIRENNR